MSCVSARKLEVYLIAFCATAVIGCGAPEETSGADGDEATTEVSGALSASGLAVTGTGTLHPLPPDQGYIHLFDATVRLKNTTTKPVTVDKQMFFFAAPGGFAFPPDLGIWFTDPIPAGATFETGGGWGWTFPVAHLVWRFDGRTSTGTRVAGIGGVPLVAAGKPSPGPSPYVDDVNVGVIAPIEILNLTGGERWLPVTGTVLDTTATATAAPTVTIRARNAAGSNVATLSSVLEDDASMPFFRRFTAWTALTPSASVANVRVTASQAIFNGAGTQTRTIPVVNATPFALTTSPVSGTWTWSNGPGQTHWHVHSGGPEARYAYDLGIQRLVNGSLQSWDGDVFVNSSFFCWDQPIRAAATGTVVFVQDSLPDNNGWLGDQNQGNNEIVIRHSNGVFTRYAHMRQGTATVTVGQTVYAGSVIALVGNAGNSSEPHLHFHAFKIDATGRQVAVPVTVPGLKSTSGASLSGIPKGGFQYFTP
jgi:hypothetical protein